MSSSVAYATLDITFLIPHPAPIQEYTSRQRDLKTLNGCTTKPFTKKIAKLPKVFHWATHKILESTLQQLPRFSVCVAFLAMRIRPFMWFKSARFKWIQSWNWTFWRSKCLCQVLLKPVCNKCCWYYYNKKCDYLYPLALVYLWYSLKLSSFLFSVIFDLILGIELTSLKLYSTKWSPEWLICKFFDLGNRQ